MVTVQVMVGFGWLYADNRVPEGETAVHVAQAAAYHEALFGAEAGTLTKRLVRMGDIPAGDPASPLLAFLSGVALELSGGHEDTTAGINVMALALLLLAAYALARCAIAPMMALLAATLTGLLPLVYAASRVATPDMLLAALLLWTVYAVARSDGFRRGGWSFLAGILAGFSLLTSPTAWIYLFPLAIVAAVIGLLGIVQDAQRGAADNSDAGKLAINLLIGLVVCGGVASPWYFRNAEALSAAAEAADAAPAPVVASDPLGLLLEWLTVLMRDGVFLPVILVALGAMLVALFAPQFRKPVVAVLFFWPVLVLIIAIPYLGDPMARYLLPLIPVLGFFLALPVAAAPTGPPRRALSLLLVVPLLLAYGNLTIAAYGPIARVEIPLSYVEGAPEDAVAVESPVQGDETDNEMVAAPAAPAEPPKIPDDVLTIYRETLTLAPAVPTLRAPRRENRNVVIAENALERAAREAEVREQVIAQVEDTSEIDHLDPYELFVYLQAENFATLSPTLQAHAQERFQTAMSALPATYQVSDALTFVQADILRIAPGAYEFRLSFRVDAPITKDWQLFLRGYVEDADLHFLPPDYRARGYIEWTEAPEPAASSWEVGSFVILPMRVQADPIRYEFRLGFFDAEQGFFGRPVVLDDIDLGAIP